MQTTHLRSTGPDREVARARGTFLRLRAELERETAAYDDARLRMLIAETPIADAAVHATAIRVRAVTAALRDAEVRFLGLLEEDRETGPPGHP